MSNINDILKIAEPTQDTFDRANNSGQYTRNAGYYFDANMREMFSGLFGDWRRLENVNSADDLVAGLTPGAFPALYGVADLAFQAAQMPFTDDAVPLPGGQAATDWYAKNREVWTKATGTEEVEDTQDLIFGVGPSLLIPTPDKAKKAATGIEKGIEFLTNVALPLRQGKLMSVGGAAQTLPPLVLTEGLEYALTTADNPEGIPGYRSDLFGSAATPETIPQQQGTTPQEFELPPSFDGQKRMADTTLQQALSIAEYDHDNIDDMDHGPGIISWIEDNQATAAGAATIGAALSVLAAKKLPWLAGRTIGPKGTDLFGEFEKTNALSTGDKMKQAFVDNKYAIYAAGKRAGFSKDELEDLWADLSTGLNPHAQNARVQTAAYNGIFPGSTRRIPPLSVLTRTVGEFTEQELADFGNALNARDLASRMKTYARGRVKSIKSRDGSRTYTVADLEKIADDAEKNPKLASAMLQARLYWDGLRRIQLEAGLITQQQAEQWAKRWPHFVHQQLNVVEGDSWLKQAAGSLPDQRKDQTFSGLDLKSLLPRSADPRRGVLPGEGIHPILAMERYTQNVVRAIIENDVKKNFFEKMLARQNGSDAFVKEITGPGASKEGVRVITFVDKGKTRYFRVNDDTLHSALLNKPALVVPIVNTMRQVYQTLTTGMLAPMFLPISLMYETSSALFLRMNGYGLGPLDEALLRTTGRHLPIDPSVFLSPVTGTARYLWGSFTSEMSTRLAASVQNNGMFAQTVAALGLDAQTVANKMHRAYMNSMHHAFNAKGGAAARAMSGHAVTALNEIESLAAIAPNIVQHHMRRMVSRPRNMTQALQQRWARVQANSVYRSYRAVMEAAHNSVKFQSFATNYARRAGETAEQWAARTERYGSQYAANARQLTGDATMTGDSPAYRVLAQQGTYVNNAAQVMYQYARAIKDHPARFALTSTAFAAAAYGWLNEMFKDDKELANYYYNTMTEHERSGAGMPLYVDENNNMKFYRLDQQLRPLFSMVVEMYGMLTGITDRQARDDEQLGFVGNAFNEVFGTGLTENDFDTIAIAQGSILKRQLLPDIIGPAPGVAIAMLGMQPGDVWSGRGIIDPPSSRLSPDPDVRSPDAAMSAFMETVLQETVGAYSQEVINSINTFYRMQKNDKSPLETADAVWEQMTAPTQERLRALPGSELFESVTREKRKHANNTAAFMNRFTYDALEKIAKYGQRGVEGSGFTGTGTDAMTTPGFNADIRGTQLALIYSRASQFSTWIAPIKQSINAMKARAEALKYDPQALRDVDQQRHDENIITLQVLAKEQKVRDASRRFEDEMTRLLGKKFRFESFEPKDWLVPLTPAPQGQPVP